MRDFEIDKDGYPYAELRVGDRTFIAYIPTLTKVYEHPLPSVLARYVALSLNRMYHGDRREDLNDIVTSPEKLRLHVEFLADACLSRGHIDHDEHLAVQLQEA